jgi:replicative DNA helicase
MSKESIDIVNFSLRASKNQFLRVFSDFTSQNKDKQLKHERGEDVSEKVPFGIDILDDKTFGGIDVGDIAMWIMRSGVGKSTVLKWTGMYACRLGYDVLHIQLEGSKQEAFDKYSQIWTKLDYKDLKFGDISKDKMDQLKNVISEMNKVGKELFIYSFEKFGEASIVDVRDIVIEYQKMKGKFPDIIIIDSLDLLKTGENTKIDTDPNWKKDKMQRVAQRMKDIATEFKTRILTATQTSDVPFSLWNDIDKVIDRSHTEGDRTLVKPFSFVFTFNATMDEIKNNVGRIFIDKFRNYKINDPICKIATKYDKGSFYDRKRTLEIMERSKKL